MPWRKEWIDPDTLGVEREEVLSKRAYEVWVSEIMLQQTRVSTVIPYFKTWISKWPTVQDLAAANPDEVLSVWKGLGYYSRATRLHTGAQQMIAKNPKTPIPNDAEALQQFPGIGLYTAGAISSIAFGEAEPVLDGNVARVLSRQLGLYVDAKDKKSTDFMWMAADGLVRHVSGHPEKGKSEIPGLWNQALMELGSTICTPRPKCDECPIQRSCKAYLEGNALLKKEKVGATVPDIEEACQLCEQLDTEDLMVGPEEDAEEAEEEVAYVGKVAKKRKANDTKATNKISQYFTSRTPRTTSKMETVEENNRNIELPDTKKRKAPQSNVGTKYIATYCSLFPKKMPKKKVAEEECLLASLWQFPQTTIPASSSTLERKTAAKKFVSTLDGGDVDLSKLEHIGELDSLLHVFTHLKLTMHVHMFSNSTDTSATTADAAARGRKWVATAAMDSETLSTGMRRCWTLAQTQAL
ncbi:DNA glycosylase [Pleomassaria siparia CBS 279.74]|uniref:Adenine DNA glycosylase n=1 Tax=Pleomassaria siparia CBS 279.74 TaxID=1314801 RepID=A0A6G1KLQ2_9PLEO|nr:DNA glycosylase [Pleomassaria siparia CBS 279.74]